MHILAHPAHMLAHPRTSTHIPSPNLSFEAFAMVMGAYRASIWSQATQHHKKTRNLLFYSMQSMVLCNQHCQKRFNLCWSERAYAKYPWASLGEPEVQKISCHIQLCRWYCIQTLNFGFLYINVIIFGLLKPFDMISMVYECKIHNKSSRMHIVPGRKLIVSERKSWIEAVNDLITMSLYP